MTTSVDIRLFSPTKRPIPVYLLRRWKQDGVYNNPVRGSLQIIYFPNILLINSLPNDKTFDWSKLKAFADNKINVTEKLKYVLDRV